MPLLDEWRKLSKQLDAQDAAVMQRLINAYGGSYERLQPEIDALIEYLAANPKLTKAQVEKSAAYKNLIREAGRELDDYTGYLKTEANTAADAAGKAGLSAGRYLILVAMADALGVSVNEIPRDTVKQAPPDALAFLANYLRKDGPLYQRIDGLSKYHADQIAAGILERVAMGNNPQVIGAWITDAYGMGLTDSMRIARTVQLYSWRQANNAVQVSNNDVLQGLVWCAELDDRVCMSCVSLHGKVFPVGSICDDHHNGRCALLPLVVGADNPIKQDGAEWFDSQDEKTQREMMGASKYEAWQDGKFEFSQLSTTHEDEVFGQMRGEASLKSILGE